MDGPVCTRKPSKEFMDQGYILKTRVKEPRALCSSARCPGANLSLSDHPIALVVCGEPVLWDGDHHPYVYPEPYSRQTWIHLVPRVMQEQAAWLPPVKQRVLQSEQDPKDPGSEHQSLPLQCFQPGLHWQLSAHFPAQTTAPDAHPSLPGASSQPQLPTSRGFMGTFSF